MIHVCATSSTCMGMARDQNSYTTKLMHHRTWDAKCMSTKLIKNI